MSLLGLADSGYCLLAMSKDDVYLKKRGYRTGFDDVAGSVCQDLP